MAKILKHIHIVGIAGTMTAPLAKALLKQNNIVTGSDQTEIYPPISDLISEIPLNLPLKDIDLAIIGSSYKSFQICRDEFEMIKNQNIPYISATNYISQNLIKKNSILVAGSFGKTTITAALAFLMSDANYFFGGVALNNLPSLNFSNSDWSIVEADESINGLDTQAKFLYYPVKYLILTGINWEHKESYKTEEDNFNAYKQLVKKIPKDGLLVYNPDDLNIQKLLPFCQGRCLPYKFFDINAPLIGRHNQQNLNAVLTLCQELNIPFNNISNFKGVKRRLEIVSEINNILIIDDFAQSAARVKSALEAVHYTYPQRKVIVYFEPHAKFLQNKTSVAEFRDISNLASDFVLGKINFSKDKLNRITAKDWQNVIVNNFHYYPLDNELIKHLKNAALPNDILIHFSSGGLSGLNNLKKVYNN